MTKKCMHHKNSSIERVTLPNSEGGRGIVDIYNLYNNQISSLRDYFHNRINDSNLHQIICDADDKYTPVNLYNRQLMQNELNKTPEKITTWKSKALHGRHAHDLDSPNVDKTASNAWLKIGELYPETVGFMVAIQDQVINTKNYKKYILKDRSVTNDSCRRCHGKSETIQHITGGCPTLAQYDYTQRHNQVANIVHQHLAMQTGLLKDKEPYYKYKPEPVLENAEYKLYYDRSIITDRTVHENRPDIVLQNKTSKETYIIDVAVPNTNNVNNTIAEKIRKYSELKDEVMRLWQAERAHIVPIVLSTTGIIPVSLHHSLRVLNIKPNLYIEMQKAVILNTCRIVRKFLSQQ